MKALVRLRNALALEQQSQRQTPKQIDLQHIYQQTGFGGNLESSSTLRVRASTSCEADPNRATVTRSSRRLRRTQETSGRYSVLCRRIVAPDCTPHQLGDQCAQFRRIDRIVAVEAA